MHNVFLTICRGKTKKKYFKFYNLHLTFVHGLRAIFKLLIFEYGHKQVIGVVVIVTLHICITKKIRS